MTQVQLVRSREDGRVVLHESIGDDRGIDLVVLAQEIAARREANPSLTIRRIAAELGRSQPWVSNVLRTLKLVPRGQKLVSEGVLSLAHAKAIASLVEKEQHSLIESVRRHALSSHQLEAIVRARRDRLR